MLDCHLSDCIIKKDHRFENLSDEEYQAFLSLSKNNDIIIEKADKGNAVLFLDKSFYVKKMEELLADTSKFVKVEFNKKQLIKLIRSYDIL